MTTNDVAANVLLQTCVKQVRSGLSFGNVSESLLMFCQDGLVDRLSAEVFVRIFLTNTSNEVSRILDKEWQEAMNNLEDQTKFVYDVPVEEVVDDEEDHLEESGVEPDDEDEVSPGEGDGEEKPTDDDDKL